MTDLQHAEYLSGEYLDQFFDDWQAYAPYLAEEHFEAGKTMTFGLPALQTLYIFLNGQFDVYGIQENGGYVLFRNCLAPMLIGENELVSYAYEELKGAYSFPVLVRLVTDCDVVTLHYQQCLSQLMCDVRFLNTLCRCFAEKLMNAGSVEIGAAFASAESKVANFLMFEADEDGLVKVNQGKAAEQLRMSYRHFHRVLRKFIDDGVVVRESGGYRVADWGKLDDFISRA